MNNEEELKDKVETNNNYDTEKEIGKDITDNEKIMEEKINNILTDLDNANKQEEQRKKTKNILLTILFIIELIIIALIVKKMLLK